MWSHEKILWERLGRGAKRSSCEDQALARTHAYISDRYLSVEAWEILTMEADSDGEKHYVGRRMEEIFLFSG